MLIVYGSGTHKPGERAKKAVIHLGDGLFPKPPILLLLI